MPELEIPVCRALARPFGTGRRKRLCRILPVYPIARIPFAYRRRVSRKSRVGPFSLGENEPIRVIVEIPSGFEAKRILSLLEGQLKKAQGVDPEVLSWTVHCAEDSILSSGRARLFPRKLHGSLFGPL